MNSFCKTIDAINEWTGRISCWLIIPMMAIVGGDVILRYVFNRPTIWSWDITVQILGALTMLSGGYVLLHDAHIAVDVLTTRWSLRTRAVVGLVTGVLFFFSVAILLWQFGDAAWDSWQVKERYPSYFAAPIYPLKIIMVAGSLLLLLQGVAKFIHDINQVKTGPAEADK